MTEKSLVSSRDSRMSVVGIGGGPFYVTTLVYALRFPLHVATAIPPYALLGCRGADWCPDRRTMAGPWRRLLVIGIRLVIHACEI
jgi:hypothetical protein